MAEAGGVGIFRVVENTNLIDFSRRQKRRTRQYCGQLERIWNAGFSWSNFCSQADKTILGFAAKTCRTFEETRRHSNSRFDRERPEDKLRCRERPETEISCLTCSSTILIGSTSFHAWLMNASIVCVSDEFRGVFSVPHSQSTYIGC